MKKLILSTGIFVLTISCFVVLNFNVYCQIVPLLPPLPLPDDQQQIKAAISSLSQSLHNGSINKVKALFKYTPNITVLQKTNSQPQEIKSIEIEKLNIDKNIATVQCEFVACDGSVVTEIPVRLEKVGVSWFLTETSELSKIISPMLSVSLKKESVNKMSAVMTGSQTITSANLLFSNTMLKCIPHPLTPTADYVYLLDWDYTYGKIQRMVFGANARLDVEGLYHSSNQDDGIVFYLDPSWNRIVYATNGWYKTYGDNPGDYQFFNPEGIAVDVHDTIFMADPNNHCVVKFVYTNGSINYVAKIDIPGINKPADIAIDQIGTFSTPSNPAADRIWVVDDFNGQIVGIYRNGTIYKRITQYTTPNNETYQLRYPIKIQTQDNDRIGFIDRERNAFVVLNASNVSTINYTEFSITPSELTCIGQDFDNEWWVGDSRGRMYHKFDKDGRYLASFTGATSPGGQFVWPITVSKAPYLSSGGVLKRAQYIHTCDPWSQFTGTRVFQPETDLLNLTFNPLGGSGCQIEFDFVLTNKSRIKVSVAKASTQALIKSYDYVVMDASPLVKYYVDKYFLGNDEYTFTFKYEPAYYTDPLNPNLWSTKTINVNFALPGDGVPDAMYATIRPVTPTTDCCESLGGGCSYKANPTCADGFYSYQWYLCTDGVCNDESLWYTLGYGQIINCSIASGNTLKCTATNNVPGGLSYNAYYKNCPPQTPAPSSSCPYVYTWDGTKFQEDNNILPQSEYLGNKGKDVTDYYRLIKQLKPQDGKYIFQIREDEHEKSFLDQFRLLAVDHPSSTKIDVSQTGEIYQYTTPFSLKQASVGGKNVIEQLMALDNNKILFGIGDTLHLKLSIITDKLSRSIQSTVTGGAIYDGNGVLKANKIGVNSHPKIEESDGESFTLRQKPTLTFVPSTLDSSMSWNIVWMQRAFLDYVNFGVLVPPNYRLNELSLSSAIHSVIGNVRQLLLAKDSTYAMLSPDQYIELRYDALPAPSNDMTRTFILISEGRYEKIHGLNEDGNTNPNQVHQPDVKEFKLNSNYPNPFNPLTKIEFQLPVEGHATVAIYDLVGREVAVLIDQNVSQGSHSVEWDASSQSSGMYFCRFVVMNSLGRVLHSDVQKIIVLR